VPARRVPVHEVPASSFHARKHLNLSQKPSVRRPPAATRSAPQRDLTEVTYRFRHTSEDHASKERASKNHASNEHDPKEYGSGASSAERQASEKHASEGHSSDDEISWEFVEEEN